MSAQSVWSAVESSESPRQVLPLDMDVCVIGAGIAGLSTAYELARRGRSVVILDADEPGSGMTGATTAHLASVLDDRYQHLASLRGEEIARIAAEAHQTAIVTIEQNVAREHIDCDFLRLDGYLIQAEETSSEELDKELIAARQAGLSVEPFETFPLAGIQGGRCLRFPGQGRFHPTKYLTGLIQAIERLGGRIVSGCRVTNVTDGNPVEVELTDGRTIKANHVVVATNSPFNDRYQIHTKQFPYLSYVIGIEVLPYSVPDILYWDTLDPYHYVRLVRPDLAIIGGEDHKTGQASNHEERFSRLEQWARDHIPNAGAVTHRWSGEVLETIDGLGHIGRNPGDKNVYIVTGDSGMGMTHGTIASHLIPALIETGSHPWADAFDPGRMPPLKGLGEYISENANVARQYLDWIDSGAVKSTEEIEPGHGAIVRDGLIPRAVYRKPTGDLVVCSAVCPHLKAIVSWNDHEKTWDCPAHGSRFQCTGELLQGPANGGLEQIEEPSVSERTA